MYVCLYIPTYIFVRYYLNVFLPSLPKVQCPNFFDFWNPWGKVMERSGLRFKFVCTKMIWNCHKELEKSGRKKLNSQINNFYATTTKSIIHKPFFDLFHIPLHCIPTLPVPPPPPPPSCNLLNLSFLHLYLIRRLCCCGRKVADLGI